ncbi:hypothetical protein GXW82_25230 [Streptacidiphilus sp. 4-A2]|nr:hypothetical protein [Streptacidiphilus sp. 4-A2]
MEALAVVLGIVVLFVGAVVGLVSLAVVKTRQAVRRAVPPARRAAEDVAIKARALTRGGAHGQVAGLRAEVRTALSASRRVLEAGSGSDPQLSESLLLLTRLDEHADELDTKLRLLEREPDQKRVEGQLAGVRERADRIVHSASSLRWAAQDRLHRFADEDLARLSEECEAEAGALRHWTPAAPGPAERPQTSWTDSAGRGCGRPDRRPPPGSPPPARCLPAPSLVPAGPRRGGLLLRAVQDARATPCQGRDLGSGSPVPPRLRRVISRTCASPSSPTPRPTYLARRSPGTGSTWCR